jgi:hypothetical protein
MDDTTAIGSLLQVIHSLGLDKILPILFALHLLASITDALLPQPAIGSHWIPLRKLLSLAAANVGHAANARQPPLVSWFQRIVVLLAAVVPAPTATTAPAPDVSLPASQPTAAPSPIPVLGINEHPT